MSAVAEHAGVRRSTLYRHFPDEEALFDACSSHWRAANPPPDPGAWAAIADPAERLARRWPSSTRSTAASRGCTRACSATNRSSRPSAPTRRLPPLPGGHPDILIAGRGLRGRAARRMRAAIGHAVAFPTWRSLAREQELADEDAVELMCALVEGSAAAPAR